MRVIGVTAEFNPLHLGHAHLLREIKDTIPAGKIMVIMPEFFSQRGVPNLLPPQIRAKIALQAGADLVLALPEIYALASAETFASGAVASLLSSGIVTDVACGAENPNLSELNKITAVLHAESKSFKQQLQAGIRDGLGFAAARERAVAKELNDFETASYLKKANNILAIEYLKALKEYDPEGKVSLRLFPRTKAASASQIREIIKGITSCPQDFGIDLPYPDKREPLLALVRDLENKMPAFSLAALIFAWQSGQGPLLLDHFAADIFYALQSRQGAEIKNIAHMQQGLAERLVKLAQKSEHTRMGLLPFIEEAASRSHPAARIRRALLSLLIGLKADDLLELKEPGFLKVLAFNKDGRYLIKMMRKTASLPLINLASDRSDLTDERARRQIDISHLAAGLWLKKSNLDLNDYYRQKPVSL